MLLLTYKDLANRKQKPFAPQEVWSEGVLEETILSWSWVEASVFCTAGWWPSRQINFNHPKMTRLIQHTHEAQEKILAMGIVTPEVLDLRMTI